MTELTAITHRPMMEDRYTRDDGTVILRMHAPAGKVKQAFARIAANYAPGTFEEKIQTLPMQCLFTGGGQDLWQVEYLPGDPRLIYDFILQIGSRRLQLDSAGVHALAPSQPFHYHHAYPARRMPAWAVGHVGYQIFPDRFRRSGKEEPGLEPWGSPRVANHYRFGGNLKGMIEAVPYLHDLGITLVYMTPIFLSDTSHRYNTFDYYQVDPLLGTKEDLKAFADQLHAHGMHLLLDGVFNHCGLGFAPFQDAREKGTDSPYYDWFFFDDKWPCGYMTFGQEWAYMPKLNLDNPDCAAYFLQVGEYWLREVGADGWRLDVSPEVSPRFWRRFRDRVLSVNSEALLVAECWDDSREWLCAEDMFDSTMNYVLSDRLWAFFAGHTISGEQFMDALNVEMMRYPDTVTNRLWNFLSSHDTPRIRTRCKTVQDMRLAVFCQMTLPGVPIVYYGDEWGMAGGMDPQCRRSMRWDRKENAMLRFYRQLIRLRNAHPALQYGRWQSVTDGPVLAYRRTCGQETLLCALNPGTEMAELPVPAGTGPLWDLLTGKCVHRAERERIMLKPGQCMLMAEGTGKEEDNG